MTGIAVMAPALAYSAPHQRMLDAREAPRCSYIPGIRPRTRNGGAWLAERDFGQLIAGGRDRDLPIVVPTHFVFDGEHTVWLHLARPNPVWEALAEHPRALLTVVDDYTYVRVGLERRARHARSSTACRRPTTRPCSSACDVRVVDDPAEKAAILDRQLAPLRARLGAASRLGGGGPGPAAAARHPRDRADGHRRAGEVQVRRQQGGRRTAREIAGRLEERGTRADIAARDHLLRRV